MFVAVRTAGRCAGWQASAGEQSRAATGYHQDQFVAQQDLRPARASYALAPMIRSVCGRWLLALLAVIIVAACWSESEDVSWTTTTTTTVAATVTLPNPPTT